MAMSPGDLAQLQSVIAAAVQATMNAQAAHVPVASNGGERAAKKEWKVLCEREFRRMEKFAGGEEAWREWEFDFRTAVRSCSTHTADAMRAAELESQPVSGEMMELTARHIYPDMAKRSSELFEVLCGLLTSEAKMLIREIPGGDGIQAWQMLAKTYSRKTLARTLRMYRDATLPKQVEAKDLVGAIAKWESGVKALERMEGEQLPNMVKMAALTEICPMEIRDMVYQNLDNGYNFDTIKEKIVSWVGNRMAAMSGPSPMDVGCVDREEWWQEEEVDIAMIKCYTCGGHGHPARICPSSSSPAGKGAGGKSYGKGKGDAKGSKGDGKGKAYGKGKDGTKGSKGDGKGKGYQGNCFHCGQLGHKAIECPNWWKQKQGVAMMNEVMEEITDESAEIGGVWMIANVEVQKKRTKTKNRFQVLTEMSDDPPELGDSEEEVMIAQVEEKREKVKCGMSFHVTDAKKLLASVAKMTEAGNEVRFGPNLEDNFVKCTKSGRITPMRKEKGMYVIDALFENGQKMMKGKIVVDSGAAENVMPAEVLANVKMMPKKKGIRFVAANGEEMKNYGMKTVTFIPTDVDGINSVTFTPTPVEGFSRRA